MKDKEIEGAREKSNKDTLAKGINGITSGDFPKQQGPT